jgi:hypothetical protein
MGHRPRPLPTPVPMTMSGFFEPQISLIRKPLIRLADLAEVRRMEENLTSHASYRIFGEPVRVRSGFKSIRQSGTEWRFSRRISDKVTCRCLSFWATRKIH